MLVTVAPLTNVAMALQRHPDLPRYLKKIVTMGGSTTVGNISPYAEANVGHDAPAARLVFESGIPLDMVGLNVTKPCPIRPDIFDRCSPTPDGPIETVMRRLIAFRNGEAMHDAIRSWHPGTAAASKSLPATRSTLARRSSTPPRMVSTGRRRRWIMTATTLSSAGCSGGSIPAVKPGKPLPA